MPAHKTSFLPDKPIIHPFAGEGVVSYGDRLLWHQLALQLNNHREQILTEVEYVQVMIGYFPDAVVENIQRYAGYFNRCGRGNGMGFRNDQPMPVSLNLRT